MKSTTVKFIDIAMSMNVHTFIVWEFIRRYGYQDGVTKDKYGRGYVSSVKCRAWIDKLANYVRDQNFTYKQNVNKARYLFRDLDRLAEEKRNERDVPREYSTDRAGNVIRYTWFGKNKTWGQLWRWDSSLGGWTFVKTVPKKVVE